MVGLERMSGYRGVGLERFPYIVLIHINGNTVFTKL